MLTDSFLHVTIRKHGLRWPHRTVLNHITALPPLSHLRMHTHTFKLPKPRQFFIHSSIPIQAIHFKITVFYINYVN